MSFYHFDQLIISHIKSFLNANSYRIVLQTAKIFHTLDEKKHKKKHVQHLLFVIKLYIPKTTGFTLFHLAQRPIIYKEFPNLHFLAITKKINEQWSRLPNYDRYLYNTEATRRNNIEQRRQVNIKTAAAKLLLE